MIGSGGFREISWIIPRTRKNAKNSGMVSTDYVAKFQDSGRFTLRKIEATDQDAPGALKNEAQRGESGKDAEKWIYTVRIEISPKHPLGIGLSHLIHLQRCGRT
jgi:hypothetical protein